MLAREKWQVQTIRVLEDVFEHRRAQAAKHGEKGATYDFKDGTGPDAAWLMPYTFSGAEAIEETLRKDYEEFEDEVGEPTWLHLVREELAEAAMEDNPERLEEELIQVAALCVAWVEKLRIRRGAR